MQDWMKEAGIDDIDPRLLEEAFRRALRSPANAEADPHAVLAAIFAEAREGTRHIFGLVAAASRRRVLH